MPTLHLLMGLPGSGKTTLAKTIAAITGARRISSDDVRLTTFQNPGFTPEEHDQLYAIIDTQVAENLTENKDVIYDANLNRLEHRQEKYLIAKQFGADVILWWVQVDTPLARTRRVTEQDIRLVPAGEDSGRMFDRIAEVMEPPKENEPFIAVDGTEITPEYIRSLLATAARS